MPASSASTPAGSARPSSRASSTLHRAGSASSEANAAMSASPLVGSAAASRMTDLLLQRCGLFGPCPSQRDRGADQLDQPAQHGRDPRTVGALEGSHRTNQPPNTESDTHEPG